MSGAFDFRDMLGGASGKVGQPSVAEGLAASIAAGQRVVVALANECDSNPELAHHLVLGFVMSVLLQRATRQYGADASLEIVASWRRLLDRQEKILQGEERG